MPGSQARSGAHQQTGSHGMSENSGAGAQPNRARFDAEPLREVLGLQGYIRKYKALTMMKNVLASEKYEKELANQRAQLTSNAALWD